MSRSREHMDEAVAWLVRLQGETVTTDDWLAFDAWLTAAPEHGEAYDAIAAEDEALKALATLEPGAVVTPLRRPASRRAVLWTGGAALAAAFVAGAVLLPNLTRDPAGTVYSTGVGERRTVALEDGSRIDLAPGSRMTVRFTRGERHVDLGDAQAFFDVAKDSSRPFVIAAGDTRVRVVGTRFDVRRRDGQVAVGVERGLVEVSTQGAKTYRLPPGRGLTHVEGAKSAKLADLVPGEAAAWRDGRLIYRDRPLTEVAGDLNRLFGKPVHIVGGKAADMRLSGVLIVDSQDAMVSRLAKLLPLEVATVDDAVELRAR
ncbi:FecR family protein [Caulobacter hibisci]|uniref:FecR domain-containing protein n=1 Tax=Caulobacter hibisci TaxID=2035993 RepID=A0ABS0ST30_9CAUL|nr:FecR domain-containing protein [Caulobacter hibisci]MBI1682810.1 FecR domain-containing protein [Caulobacter hibisci]